jgi:hypothetical protein
MKDRSIDISLNENHHNKAKNLFGNGGYIPFFESKYFHTAKGLGVLEVITKDELSPVKQVFVLDPISELQKHDVSFTFIDLHLSQNQRFIQYSR